MVDNPLGIIVCEGETHSLVTTLKRRFGFAVVNDSFDEAFTQRIRGVQMMHSLRTHGQLDMDTLKALGVDYEVHRGDV